jgi:hypothetical protein
VCRSVAGSDADLDTYARLARLQLAEEGPDGELAARLAASGLGSLDEYLAGCNAHLAGDERVVRENGGVPLASQPATHVVYCDINSLYAASGERELEFLFFSVPLGRRPERGPSRPPGGGRRRTTLWSALRVGGVALPSPLCVFLYGLAPPDVFGLLAEPGPGDLGSPGALWERKGGGKGPAAGARACARTQEGRLFQRVCGGHAADSVKRGPGCWRNFFILPRCNSIFFFSSNRSRWATFWHGRAL